MLRFLYTLLDFLGSIFVILSPVAFLHLMLKAIQVEAFHPVTCALDGIFGPTLLTIRQILNLPPTQIGHMIVTVEQIALVLLLTGLFFACQMGSGMLKATELQINLTEAALKRSLQKKKKEMAQKKQEKQQLESRRLWVMVYFTGMGESSTQALLHQFIQLEANSLQTADNRMLLEFKQAGQALQYVTQLGQTVLKRLRDLRPMDEKPLFRIVLHAPKTEDNLPAAVEKCHHVSRLAAENQVLLTEEFHKVLKGISLEPITKYYSMGFYDIHTGKEEEIFRLQL